MPDVSRAYDPFAELYDRYWGGYFLGDAREGIANRFLPRVPAGGTILDVCCGTGQLAHWLTGCGFRVIGVDSSPPMLQRALRNAPKARFLAADVRRFTLTRPVDAALSTFDSVNHLPTIDDVGCAFACVREALEPSGWFLFDVNRRDGFELAADESFSVVEDDCVCVARSRFDRTTGVGASSVTMLLREADESWRRSDVLIREFCYETEQLEERLETAGFVEWERFDAEADLGMPRGEGRDFFLARRD